VIIAYDDSDGWYDHVYSGVTNPSNSVADALTGTGMCGSGTPLAGQQGRCGYGPRQPFVVISPWARHNAVDSTLTDLSSVTRFVEDNWLRGQQISGSAATVAGSLDHLFSWRHPDFQPLILNPVTGEPGH